MRRVSSRVFQPSTRGIVPSTGTDLSTRSSSSFVSTDSFRYSRRKARPTPTRLPTTTATIALRMGWGLIGDDGAVALSVIRAWAVARLRAISTFWRVSFRLFCDARLALRLGGQGEDLGVGLVVRRGPDLLDPGVDGGVLLGQLATCFSSSSLVVSSESIFSFLR